MVHIGLVYTVTEAIAENTINGLEQALLYQSGPLE